MTDDIETQYPDTGSREHDGRTHQSAHQDRAVDPRRSAYSLVTRRLYEIYNATSQHDLQRSKVIKPYFADVSYT